MRSEPLWLLLLVASLVATMVAWLLIFALAGTV